MIPIVRYRDADAVQRPIIVITHLRIPLLRGIESSVLQSLTKTGFVARAYREGTRLMTSSCSIGGAASHKRAKLSLIVLAFLAEVDESSQDEHRVICVARAESVNPTVSQSDDAE